MMQAPLPEVPPQIPDRQKESFHELNLVCGFNLCLIFSRLAFEIVFRTPETGMPAWKPLFWSLSCAVFQLSLLLPLWSGFNWARRVNIGYCLFYVGATIFETIRGETRIAASFPALDRFLLLADAAFMLFLLIWLFLPGVKAHFRTTMNPGEVTAL